MTPAKRQALAILARKAQESVGGQHPVPGPHNPLAWHCPNCHRDHPPEAVRCPCTDEVYERFVRGGLVGLLMEAAQNKLVEVAGILEEVAELSSIRHGLLVEEYGSRVKIKAEVAEEPTPQHERARP